MKEFKTWISKNFTLVIGLIFLFVSSYGLFLFWKYGAYHRVLKCSVKDDIQVCWNEDVTTEEYLEYMHLAERGE